MDIKIAEQINAWLCECQFHTMGMRDATCFEQLRDISLDDMLLAARTIERRSPQKNEAGHQVFTAVCDDRAIAATYVLLHFEAMAYSDLIDPNQRVDPILKRGNEFVAVIDLSQ